MQTGDTVGKVRADIFFNTMPYAARNKRPSPFREKYVTQIVAGSSKIR